MTISIDVPHHSVLVTKANHALDAVDSLLLEAQAILSALKSGNSLPSAEVHSQTVKWENALTELKDEVVLLENTKQHLDELLEQESSIDIAALREQRGTLRMNANAKSRVLRACLTKCYRLQDIIEMLTQNVEHMRDEGTWSDASAGTKPI